MRGPSPVVWTGPHIGIVEFNVVSRYLVIALALALTVFRLTQREWIAAAGLAGLAGGLIVLQLAARRPALKPLAWASFAVTAIAMVLVYLRMRAAM